MAQFKHCVRLEKIAPLPAQSPSGGWLGGKPNVPETFDWPHHNGIPMLFLAQFDCTQFPRDLWGGVGPRKGWLLFFMRACSGPQDDRVVCKVLHIEQNGTAKTMPIDAETFSKVDLFGTWKNKDYPSTATPFPEWPVRMLCIEENGASEPQGEGLNPTPTPPEAEDPTDAIYPTTAALLDALVVLIAAALAQNVETLEAMQSQLLADSAQVESAGEKGVTARDAQQHLLNVDALAVLEGVMPQAVALRDGHAKFQPSRHPHAPDASLNAEYWADYSTHLKTRDFISVEWHDVVPKIDGNTLVFLEQSPAFAERLATFGDLQKELKLLRSQVDRMLNDRYFGLQFKGDRQDQHIQRFTEASPDDPELFEHLRKCSDIAQQNKARYGAARPVLEGTITRIDDVLKEHAPAIQARQLVTEDDWNALKPKLRDISKLRFIDQDGCPPLDAIRELRVTRCPLADYATRASHYRWHIAQKRRVFQHYFEDPAAFPDGPRAFVAHMALTHANSVHDSIGGLPRWDWVDPGYFDPSQYWPPENRDPFFVKVIAKDPPYDEDNAVLLQLFTSDMMGWSFGHHVVFILPRRNLAQGDFSEIMAIISG